MDILSYMLIICVYASNRKLVDTRYLLLFLLVYFCVFGRCGVPDTRRASTARYSVTFSNAVSRFYRPTVTRVLSQLSYLLVHGCNKSTAGVIINDLLHILNNL